MILPDSSIWIDHFRSKNQHLSHLLMRNGAFVHPWIVGELACGNLSQRRSVLKELRKLPQIPTVREDEVLHMIERHKLMGRGIGYIDMHLMASALAERVQIWTRDKRLHSAASTLNLTYIPLSGAAGQVS